MAESPTEQAPAREIVWFKTAYVPAEDRLRFSCSLRTGDTDAFWLTHRLGSVLVRKLVEWLDKVSVQDERFAGDTHRAAQASALANRPKKPPEPIAEAPAWLANAVNIRNIRQGVLLTFKDEAERAVCVAFDPARLRQWLNVLHAQWRRSGWGMDVWPDWMAEAAGDKTPEDRGLLH